MQCGVACLCMVAHQFRKHCSLDSVSKICHATSEGVSFKSISDAAKELSLTSVAAKVGVSQLNGMPLPAILHWNQNHFVVLYKVSGNGKNFYVADPGEGLIKYSFDEFCSHWTISMPSGENCGLAMFFEPDINFKGCALQTESENKSFRFLFGYMREYRRFFLQIALGLLLGCVLQLILPFLTQWIVDIGIRYKDIGFIWLVLFGELMIVAGRTATDFIRRWLLLHISLRINISLVSDFFRKLLKLPMSFFDTKLMGDLLQRIGDHSRVQGFLTNRVLGVAFTFLSFVVFGIVLFVYSRLIFCVFLAGSIIYGLWITAFLCRRKALDYELFGLQARNQDKTYQFITSMQEIKLQDCELRRRWEWEDVQADLFVVQMKSLKLQQTQEAGSIFINEVKNIIITVLAATAVINGQMTLGAMLAVQYIIGQLNSPVEQLMSFIYSLQDVKISLERINEIHQGRNEESRANQAKEFASGKSIRIDSIDFKYDPHSLKKTLDGVSFDIPEGKVTAIVGASGSGKTTLIKLMLGYYPVASGTISIAGRDIREYNLKWWRRQCGVVMQDGVIFSESIARNIAVGEAT